MTTPKENRLKLIKNPWREKKKIPEKEKSTKMGFCIMDIAFFGWENGLVVIALVV